MSLTIEIEPSLPFSTTLHLEGRLDNDTAKTFDEELEKALDSPVKVLVFDLAKLDYISSAGILSVLKAQKAMAARNGKTLFGYLQPGVKKVFDIVQAVDLSTVFASVEELDRYLDTIQKQLEE
jgi:anti-anti-sigma factor